ncbi:MAG TPA: GTP 3',8-cyclase MoaA [Thermoanaerobaculia bacterium]|nr:GTP 3',8-cyclase MoaA [Thermoanaerobaculia bacterium]
MALTDRLGRPLGNLRLSVTDRCNLRCDYCMPEKDYVWLPRGDLLQFEEIGRLADVFGSLGVDRIRLTGGEPLVRQDLPALVEILAGKPWLKDLAMTTNGVLLEEHAAALRAAGLHRITVSLDTLQPERFQKLARFDELPRVLRGIEAAARAGFASLKIDTVVIRGVNDDELAPLVERAKEWGAEVRFIEYMDVGGATRWSRDRVVSRLDMFRTLAAAFGAIEPIPGTTSAPAERFRLKDGTVFGIIASTTDPFCSACDRSRLTADGLWYLCLYAARGLDLRKPLREGASAEDLRALIASAWGGRADRGAEERLAVRERAPLVPLTELKRDPHLEMHTRGG